jgi:hypothetical protein
MKKLVLSKVAFFEYLNELIASGVTFEAEENNNNIIITFTGGC